MISKFFKQTKNHPPFWKDYLQQMAAVPAGNCMFDSIRYVSFDTETTGLNPKKDKILSIGAVAVKNWDIDIKDRFECLLNQSYTATADAIEVHGLLTKNNTNQVEEQHALQSFVHYLGNAVLIGHNVSFDVSIINHALFKYWGVKLKNKCIDTMYLANRLYPANHIMRPGDLTLDKLGGDYKITLSDRHTASGDSFITALLFLKMSYQLQKRGCTQLKDLMRKRKL